MKLEFPAWVEMCSQFQKMDFCCRPHHRRSNIRSLLTTGISTETEEYFSFLQGSVARHPTTCIGIGTECSMAIDVFTMCSIYRTQNEVIGLCSVQLTVNRPNGICVKSRQVLHSLLIPLGAMDWNGQNKLARANQLMPLTSLKLCSSDCHTEKWFAALHEQGVRQADCCGVHSARHRHGGHLYILLHYLWRPGMQGQ